MNAHESPETATIFECDEGNGPCNNCADCVDVEPESLWRERHELLADFDAIEPIESGVNSVAAEKEQRRIELDVAIGTRDAIADVVDELRIFNASVRSLVETSMRKAIES